MPTNWSDWRRSILALLGMLVIGAIGSGLWQRLGDPIYVWGRDALLNIATLGLVTLKDALYADVSRGLHESASTRLLGIFLFFSCYALTLMAIILSIGLRRMDRLLNDRPEAKSKEELRLETSRLRRRLRRMLKFGLWPIIVLTIVVTAFSIVRTTYTVRAIAHYNQLINLVGPFLNEAEVKRFNSRFAQIRSASDYVQLTRELSSIARNNDLQLPSFEPW